ncbi:MAG TPA: LuxR C-terminal-related transcriptional regulator [Candidatus Saccharimonadales bacterium]|nr:LuxR C-terminal-related transcriptional regulator [Candidatus Saccharimonadales bacterium]
MPAKKPIDTPAQIATLTAFELDVLQDKACGLTDAAVGDKRNHASISTAKSWLRDIFEKLGYYQDDDVAKDIENPAARAVCAVLRAKKIAGPPGMKGKVQGLSREEQSVLDFVSLGYSTPQIASYLYSGEETVKARIQSAGKKLGVKSRVQIAAAAIAHGLIE